MTSFLDVFSLVKEFCAKEISDINYDLWIKPIEPVRFNGQTAVLMVESKFLKNVVIDNYLEILKKAFFAIMGFNVEIIVLCPDDVDETEPEIEAVASPVLSDDPVKRAELNKSYADAEYEYTFDNFIIGSSNNFAYAACKAVTAEVTNNAYNPLFIYGPSGVGKTHLLRAIGHEIMRNYPYKKVVYVSGESFMNDFYKMVQSSQMDKFREKYRNSDVLLVDDIQFLSGKDRMQEEFFHTYEYLYQNNKQIVLSSDRPPKDINVLEERLRNRFENGLLCDISYPDFETRITIIRRKAQLLNIEIPDDVVHFIANKLKTNIRQLEGAVKKIKALKLLASTPPSVSMAQNVVNDILNDNVPIPITVDRILQQVSITYDVSVEDIKSKKRSSNISNARQIAMYIMKQITSLKLEEIGERLGGKNHSTVIYSISQVENQMKTDPTLKAQIEDIIKNIKN